MSEDSMRFKEFEQDEIFLAGQEHYESLAEIISRIDGRRVGNRIMPVRPQMNWQEIWRSIKHFLVWDQRTRVRYILEILSRPEEGAPMVDIKSLEELEESKDEVYGDLAIVRSQLAAVQEKLHEIEKIHKEDNRRFWEKILQYPIDDSPDQTDPLFRIGAMNICEREIRKVRSQLFFALTPAGLERKKYLVSQEEARKEAARNKLLAERDARETLKKILDEIVSDEIGGEEAMV